MEGVASASRGTQEEAAAERARFGALQAELSDRFERFRKDPTLPYTAVVVPSQSVDPKELRKLAGAAHYEERSLFNLMLLRYPRLKVVFVTSKRLDPLIVDYYLHQMRGIPPGHARRRLLLFDCDDASPRPLTAKLLERPRLLERIREAIDEPAMAHLNVFNSSPLERALAVQLGIPLNACDPDLTWLGTKTGARRAFADAGVPVPPGRDGLRDFGDLVEAVAELWAEVGDARRLVVKLDDSFSGEGNGILELDYVTARGDSAVARARAVREALPRMRLEAAGLDWEEYRAQFDRMGGICELWLEGQGKTSPSAQFRINPLGDVLPVSTHDQVLGGPSGQVFQGACFPADQRYRLTIQELGRRIGAVLAGHGVIGRFGVDYLYIPDADPGGAGRVYALEINLRQGGTTHPFNTLKFMTDGRYDEESGRFFTAQGRERAYFATDNLVSPAYRGILPFDLIDTLVLNGTHFRADETGVLFHMLGCLSEFGKLGATAIAPDVAEARALYQDTVRLLDQMAAR